MATKPKTQSMKLADKEGFHYHIVMNGDEYLSGNDNETLALNEAKTAISEDDTLEGALAVYELKYIVEKVSTPTVTLFSK